MHLNVLNLATFSPQSKDSELLQELSAFPLHVSQHAQALLQHRQGGLPALWQHSHLRRILTDSLPRLLSLLQHASLLGQQELRSESTGVNKWPTLPPWGCAFCVTEKEIEKD